MAQIPNQAPQPREAPPYRSVRFWLGGLLPLALLAGLIALFAWGGSGLIAQPGAPVEVVSFERVVLQPNNIQITLRNTGPAAITVAQMIVDDAVWPARYDPSPTIGRLFTAEIDLGYPWVEGERHEIKLVTTNGIIFVHEIPAATLTPKANSGSVLGFGVMGLYVGIVPVGLGLLWFPFLKKTGKGTLNFVLALTVGLLAFLLVDTVAEGLDMAGALPGVFRGFPALILAGVLSLMVLVALAGRGGSTETGSNGRLRLAYLIATGIGLHNLGEGLAIGSAFAIGEASLGTFLVIGFTLHNITEGVGIAAPMLKDRPGLGHFLRLALLAGGPAIIGTWLGAFAQASYLTVIFFGIGAGAIAQVIYEVGKLLLKESDRAGNWLNVSGFAAGVAIMYLTALLVP